MDPEYQLAQLDVSFQRKTVQHAPSTTAVDVSGERDSDTLARLGKRQVLKRRFGFVSMLSFSCTVLVTWEGVLVLFTSGFTNGGPAGMVYGFLIVWCGTLSIFITIAELASMAPTASGQYHWVSMLAPRSARKFLSYITGWLTVLAWQSVVASGGYVSGTMIQGLLVLNHPSYVPQQWHGTLLFWAVIFASVFVNTVVGSLLPKVEVLILILHVLGFCTVLIVLSYMAPHNLTSDVFTTFLNEGNWSSQGLSFFIGLLGLSFSFVGADAAVHMSEEIENPCMTVPQSIITSIALNGCLGFGILIATLYSISDTDKVLNSATHYPFMEIFFEATASSGGATALASIVVALSICSTIGFVATSSRMIWSFARDRGLPFSKLLSKLEPRTSIPIYSITVTTVLACLLALINLGSSTVLNDVLSLSVAGFYATYFICSALLLWCRCTGKILHVVPSASPITMVDPHSEDIGLTWGPWRIPGVLGIVNNAFACAYMMIIWFFSFWPPTNPTSASTMNYASLVAGSVILFSIVYYFIWGRKFYDGPVVEISADHGSVAKRH